MKYSIKQQIASVFIVVIIMTFMLAWVINNFFLERFYIAKKQFAIQRAYEQLNEVSLNGSILSDEFDVEFRKICDMYNFSIIVIDSESNTVRTSATNTQLLIKRLYDSFFTSKLTGQEEKYLAQKDNYSIALTMDVITNTEYMEMWGVLGNGNMFLIRSPLEGIRDSVSVSNQFLAYVGLGSVLISTVIIIIFAGRITKPIMQLKDISEKMTGLDFDTRYESKGINEIDLLGEHINQLSSKLEQTISELKTANNELQRDIEKKEEIDEMRKEFLSNVSHELKTPIALIQGYAEGLKEGMGDDDAQTRDYYCEVIVDEASKMNNMVKKLLDLNQLEFGSQNVTMERFDIVALINNFVQSAQILIQQSNVKVEVQKSEPVFVWADEFKVEEVVQNYFSNALNHVSGDRVIEIRYRLAGEENNRVRISVFNTGTPIPEESIGHIWEKFYKVDKARTREYGGSGVGLSIVKAIMDLMNQEYGVINYANGVEFWFELETKV